MSKSPPNAAKKLLGTLVYVAMLAIFGAGLLAAGNQPSSLNTAVASSTPTVEAASAHEIASEAADELPAQHPCKDRVLTCAAGTRERVALESGECAHWCAGDDDKTRGKSVALRDGRVSNIIWYQDGLRHGPFSTFHEGGAPAIEGHYQTGRRSGAWRARSAQGELIARGRFVAGMAHGLWRFFGDRESCSFSRGELRECKIAGKRMRLSAPLPQTSHWMVSTASAQASVPVGSQCELSITPLGVSRTQGLLPLPPRNCNVSVRWADRAPRDQRDQHETLAAYCDVVEGEVVRVLDVTAAGDTRMHLDATRKVLSLSAPQGSGVEHIQLSPSPPAQSQR